MNSDQHIIVAGEGVGACRIGADKQTAIETFGPPSTSHSNYLEFSSAGLEVSFDEKNDRTIALFFYFRSPSHVPFRGTTNLGIGIDSSIEDVLAKYGRPSSMADMSEKSISYSASGIDFTFVDDLLVDIRIRAAIVDPWPEEWPRLPTTDDSTWIAFSSDGGEWFQPVRHAHASFFEFARIAELERFRILPTFEEISIKAFFETEPGNPMFGEHIYLTDIHTDCKTITARLNASSFRRADLKEGQEVTFPIERLSDWFLVRMGKGVGGFTIANVWSELSAEVQAEAAQAPPFSWFTHRGNRTAEDELIAIPLCSRCKRRSLLLEAEYKDGICGICNGGGRRCNCPKCGAPLIRFKDMPDLCTRCLSQSKERSQKSWWQFWK